MGTFTIHPRTVTKALRKARLHALGTVAIGSGVSDVYQPVEAELELTRRCAEVLSAMRLPVVLATKSSLVERDLDLWSDIAGGPGFTLLMTIVTTNSELAADADRLHASLERYASWLDGKRRYFNRRRSLHADWVTEELYADLATEESDGRLFGNRKLLRFVRKVLDGGVFDYASRQLLPPGVPQKRRVVPTLRTDV